MPAGKKRIKSNLQTLRKRAEEKLTAVDKAFKDMSAPEMSTLIHELNTLQIELEMQNETLRKSQAETERSRKAYQDLWDLSPAGYLVVDFAGRVIAANRAAQRLFGRPEKALLNERLSTLVDPENQVTVHFMFEKTAVTGLAERQEIRISKPGGAIHICLLEVGSLGGEPGREKIQAVLTDITKQKQAEDDLRKNNEKNVAILDSLMEHVVYCDREMRILWANKAACESVGLKREDLFDRICHELWADRRTPCEDCPVIKARDTGQPQMAEKMTPDGRWWHIKGFPVRDKNGHVSGMTELALDTTERMIMQEALQESEIRFRELFNHMGNGVAIFRAIDDGADFIFLDFNEAGERIDNIEKKDLIGKSLLEMFPGVNESGLFGALQRVWRTGKPEHHPISFYKDDRISGWRQNSIYRLPSGEIVAVFEDITGRKQMEDALRKSRQRFKSIFENAPIGFYRTTFDGRILDANPALLQILGYASFEELATVNLETHDYHPKHSRRQFRERVKREGEIRAMESFWKRSDGTLVYIRENARAIRDDDGNIIHYEGTIEDINDQRQAEEDIRSLSQQLIKAQEDERQMISRELHDRVAQDLSTLLIGLSTLSDHLPNVIPEVQKKALELSEILRGTINAVRDLSYDLRLPGLEGIGLIPALSMYCEEFAEKHSLKVDFQSSGMKDFRLDFETEMNLYRLIQEGLNNIYKHAAASRATIRLIGAYPNIILRIEDNGQGFDVEERARTAYSEKRMGLRSMTERVRLIQGEMTIQSQPMKGTRVLIKFPYQEEKHDSKKNDSDHR